jgi:hypothetical protein
MNALQLVMIFIATSIILGTIYFLWKNKYLEKHKKKIGAIITIGTITSAGVTLSFLGNVIIYPGDGVSTEDYVIFRCNNENYTTAYILGFEKITVSENWVKFNDTSFNITSSKWINITINYIKNNTQLVYPHDTILRFNASTIDGTSVTFQIGGLTPEKTYLVKRNGTEYASETANSTGDIQFTNSNFLTNSKNFTVEYAAENTTIRTYGIDYFTWTGMNTTAYWVKKNISGLDEPTEYIAHFDGNWTKFYGDKTGSNFTVKTFDIIKTYMNDLVGNTTFNISFTPDINYSINRTVVLDKRYQGYNYTAWTEYTNTSVKTISTQLTLPRGYYAGLWNRTTFTWNYWISGFGITNKPVWQYDVIVTKIDADKTWNI